MGATHENEMGFDPDSGSGFAQSDGRRSLSYYPELASRSYRGKRVGTVPTPVTFHHFGEPFRSAGLYVAVD